MLRPSNSILGSSRAARRAGVRADLTRMVTHVGKGVSRATSDLYGTAVDLLLLALLPPLYLAAAYLSLVLPLRWLFGREPLSLMGVGTWCLAAIVDAAGITRAVQGAAPIAPVRSPFARALLVVAWSTALLLAVADLARPR